MGSPPLADTEYKVAPLVNTIVSSTPQWGLLPAAMGSAGPPRRLTFLIPPPGTERHPLPVRREHRIAGAIRPGELAEIERVGAARKQLEHPARVPVTDHDPRPVRRDRQTPAATGGHHHLTTREPSACCYLRNFRSRTQIGDHPKECDQCRYSPWENT